MSVFNGKLLIIGFGCVGQAILPLLQNHESFKPKQIEIISPNLNGEKVANYYGLKIEALALTQQNYISILADKLKVGDFLLNLSVDVSSCDLIAYCIQNQILYLDTCIEPWAGRYMDKTLAPSERSNYQLREELLALRKVYPTGTTCVVTHGANPGLASHFVKQALINLGIKQGILSEVAQKTASSYSKNQWAMLANQLEIKSIHIAEKDTQETSVIRKKKEFVNTWSIDGLISEGAQPAELGWGSHEKILPANGASHASGCQAAIYLKQPGLMTKVHTWTPSGGSFLGYVITHNEAISLADYFTLVDPKTQQLVYRPTVHYSYHPSSDTQLSIHEFIGNHFNEPDTKRLLNDEIDHGMDELGVLLLGPKHNAYWYGSTLNIQQARELAKFNSATSLQIAAGVLSGMIWAIRHPACGIVEPEEMDFQEVLEIAKPYLGNMVGEYSDWTPLKNRSELFSQKLDHQDPWQFQNFVASY
jgi:homospermidine synthase